MIKDQRRLIHADERNPALITHHCAPRSGTVHTGHPRMCEDRLCVEWGAELLDDTANYKIIPDDKSAEWPPRQPHLVYVAMGVLLAILLAFVATGAVVIVLKNIFFIH